MICKDCKPIYKEVRTKEMEWQEGNGCGGMFPTGQVLVDQQPTGEVELCPKHAMAERLTEALRTIAAICQDERLPCGQIYEITEEALAEYDAAVKGGE